MKRQTVSFGRYLEMVRGAGIPNAERSATKSSANALCGDVTIGTWTNREAMARTVRMQQQRASRPDDWRPIVKLTDVEGY